MRPIAEKFMRDLRAMKGVSTVGHEQDAFITSDDLFQLNERVVSTTDSNNLRDQENEVVYTMYHYNGIEDSTRKSKLLKIRVQSNDEEGVVSPVADRRVNEEDDLQRAIQMSMSLGASELSPQQSKAKQDFVSILRTKWTDITVEFEQGGIPVIT